jgi:hypothetical protein
LAHAERVRVLLKDAETDTTKRLLVESYGHANMNKAKIIKNLEEYLKSDHLRDRFNLTTARLLKDNYKTFAMQKLIGKNSYVIR